MNLNANTHKADILVGESAPETAELFVEALRDASFAGDIAFARDGEEALSFLFCRAAHAGRSSDDLPRLILLDANLPKVSGVEVLKRAKSDPRTKAIPAVILTSPDDTDFAMDAYQLGANSCLRKSPDRAEFAKSIRAAGVYWIAVNRPASGPGRARGAGPQ